MHAYSDKCRKKVLKRSIPVLIFAKMLISEISLPVSLTFVELVFQEKHEMCYYDTRHPFVIALMN